MSECATERSSGVTNSVRFANEILVNSNISALRWILSSIWAFAIFQAPRVGRFIEIHANVIFSPRCNWNKYVSIFFLRSAFFWLSLIFFYSIVFTAANNNIELKIGNSKGKWPPWTLGLTFLSTKRYAQRRKCQVKSFSVFWHLRKL